MARTKQTARKSTGGKAPRKQLASKFGVRRTHTFTQQSKIKEILTEYHERKRLLKQQSEFTNNKDLVNRYKNDESLVKVWISQDQKKKQKEDLEKINENAIVKYLQDLTLDLKYEIISFIPTYSNTYALTTKFNVERNIIQTLSYSPSFMGEGTTKEDLENIQEIKKQKILDSAKCLLEPKSVKEECKMTIDTPLLTFHKMRIINKEFNRRMKLKILNLEHLDLNFILNKSALINAREMRYNPKSMDRQKCNLWDLVTLLRLQRLYKDFKEKSKINNFELNEMMSIEKREDILIENILQLDHITFYDEKFEDYKEPLNPTSGEVVLQQLNQQHLFTPTISNFGGTLFGSTTNLTPIPFTSTTSSSTVQSSSSETLDNDVEMKMNNNELPVQEKKVIDSSVDIFELSENDLQQLEQELSKSIKEEKTNSTVDKEKGLRKPTLLEEPEEIVEEQRYTHYSNTFPANQLFNNNAYSYPVNMTFRSELVEYIGNNQTIKSLQFDCLMFNNYTLKEDLKLLFGCLKNLTTISFLNYQEDSYNAFVATTTLTNTLPSVKEVNLIFMNNINFSFISNIVNSSQMKLFENLERINIFPLFDEGYPNNLEEVLKTDMHTVFQNACANVVTDSYVFVERNPITNENKVHYTINNTEGKRNIGCYFTFGHNLRKEDWIWLTQTYLNNNSVTDIILKQPFLYDNVSNNGMMNLKMKKWLLEYWIKNNYFLVENFSFDSLSLEEPEQLCLIQYLIYLANEYQNGRIFYGMKQGISSDIYLYLVKYGYSYENQIIEILQLCNSGTSLEILPTLIDALPLEKEDTINEIAQYVSLKISDTNFLEYFFYVLYQHYGKEVLKKILLRPVYCLDALRNLLELPLLVNLHRFNAFVFLELIEVFTAEELLSINHEGNNICQLLSCMNLNIENRLILKIIEKAPELLYTKNNDGETLLHICCQLGSVKANLAYYLIKDLGISLLGEQCDNKGRSVKQLLEKQHPLVAKVLYQYEGFPQHLFMQNQPFFQ